ncbi:MAG: hypothetical protein LBI61_00300 [Puniceicoccales bacterium]|jgi:hypothetical protein|nr:hypothetical protein [Puniceicoccales bacterium]
MSVNKTISVSSEKFKCEKHIRDNHGNVSRALCNQKKLYKFTVDAEEVEKTVFRRLLSDRVGKEEARVIIRKLKTEVNRKAWRREEPCVHSCKIESAQWSNNPETDECHEDELDLDSLLEEGEIKGDE